MPLLTLLPDPGRALGQVVSISPQAKEWKSRQVLNENWTRRCDALDLDDHLNPFRERQGFHQDDPAMGNLSSTGESHLRSPWDRLRTTVDHLTRLLARKSGQVAAVEI